jgi:hypothetical protein
MTYMVKTRPAPRIVITPHGSTSRCVSIVQAPIKKKCYGCKNYHSTYDCIIRHLMLNIVPDTFSVYLPIGHIDPKYIQN